MQWSAARQIVVPTVSSARSLPIIVTEQQQESKRCSEPKIFIAPKHSSVPLAFNSQKWQITQRHFSPSFDSFDLSKLFQKKKLTQDQINLLESLNQIDEESFKTPPEKRVNTEKEWSNFQFIDNHLHSTSTSHKNHHFQEEKKSRPKQKGLKKLSQRAYEIVLKMNSVSYKQVANQLVDELNRQQELDQKGKDEKNIKRRVYDALNVLIALGVLRKEGKKIAGDQYKELHYSQSMAEKVREELHQKEKIIKEKQQQIKYLEQKYNVYKRLYEQHRVPSLQRIEQKQKILFPFLVLNRDKQGKMDIWNDKEGERSQMTVKWEKKKNNYEHFDIDLLVEYSRTLSKINK